MRAIILCFATVIGGMAETPSIPTAESQLAIARAQLRLQRAYSEALEAQLKLVEAREAVKALDAQYAALVADERAKADKADGCLLDDSQRWQCPPVESAKAEAPE